MLTGRPTVFRSPGRELPQAAAVAELRERFPGVPVWFGRHTGRFWALVGELEASRLVEAITPQELAAAIRHPRVWPWP